MNWRYDCQASLLILLDSFVSVWFNRSSGPARLVAEIRGSEWRRRRW